MAGKSIETFESQPESTITRDALLEAIQVGIDDVKAGCYERFHSPEALETRILEIWDQAVGDVKAA